MPKTTKKSPAKKTTKKASKKYEVTVSMGDEVQKDSTAKAEELSSLLVSLKPVVIKADVKINVKYGKKSVDKTFTAMKARQVLRPIYADVLSKQLLVLLNG